MFKKLKEYKVELASIAVTAINIVLIKRNLKQIKELREHPKYILFK